MPHPTEPDRDEAAVDVEVDRLLDQAGSTSTGDQPVITISSPALCAELQLGLLLEAMTVIGSALSSLERLERTGQTTPDERLKAFGLMTTLVREALAGVLSQTDG